VGRKEASEITVLSVNREAGGFGGKESSLTGKTATGRIPI